MVEVVPLQHDAPRGAVGLADGVFQGCAGLGEQIGHRGSRRVGVGDAVADVGSTSRRARATSWVKESTAEPNRSFWPPSEPTTALRLLMTSPMRLSRSASVLVNVAVLVKNDEMVAPCPWKTESIVRSAC